MKLKSKDLESVSRMASSSGMARADEVMAKLGMARVKKAATNWSWEEEEMMYEMNTRSSKRQKRRLEASLETSEQKKAKKDEKLMNMYMREERKLFLGGLAEVTTEKDLRATFNEFGTIVDCKVMRDHESGKSRGFGFVTFAQEDQVDACQNARPLTIDGKTVN